MEEKHQTYFFAALASPEIVSCAEAAALEVTTGDAFVLLEVRDLFEAPVPLSHTGWNIKQNGTIRTS